MKWKVLKHFLPDIPGFTHASNPTYHGGNVYFSARDSKNRSHIFSSTFNPVELTIGKPSVLLEPGPKGSFDESGCSISDVTDGEILYLGWNLGVTVPFYNTLGSSDGLKRKIRVQRNTKYLSISYGIQVGGRIWFGAITEWPMKCVMIGNPGLEYDDIVSRFSVIGNEMWFCHRKREGQYQLAHADLIRGEWSVNGSLKIERSGFDEKSQCYPWVFDSGGSRYMLYNGDGYGKTGFSLAIMEEQ